MNTVGPLGYWQEPCTSMTHSSISVLACGGHDYDDINRLEHVLDAFTPAREARSASSSTVPHVVPTRWQVPGQRAGAKRSRPVRPTGRTSAVRLAHCGSSGCWTRGGPTSLSLFTASTIGFTTSTAPRRHALWPGSSCSPCRGHRGNRQAGLGGGLAASDPVRLERGPLPGQIYS